MEPVLSTNWNRAPLALGAGAVVGGLLSGLFTLVSGLFTSGPDLFLLWVGVAVVTVVAAFVWLAFIVVLGVPVWIVLHRLGKRSAATAGGTGFMVTLFGKLAFTALSDIMMRRSGPWTDDGANPPLPWQIRGANVVDGYRTIVGWQNELIGASLLAIAGVIVGLVIWKVAYRTKLAGG